MDPTEALKEILDRHAAAPFLFIGSGFSRRYLGLEDWSGLLTRFCQPIKEFGYYRSRANGDLPATASHMSADYNEWWWNNTANDDERSYFREKIESQSDALKFDISRYISGFSLEDARKSDFGGELASISDIAVDGVITTNWDSLIEEIFPDYKVFVGQEELLFSNPQSIGEIYKIHGSATDPKSLVLTSEDYNAFGERNPYLAAKLVTIFVEHPIIFMGYSIADLHIQEIIISIAKCLPQNKIGHFQDNLIFVERVKVSGEPSVEKSTIKYDASSITMMIAKVSSYEQVFKALVGRKRKIPARVLRFFREQVYELVHSDSDENEKVAVVDYEDIETAEDIEFVVGVGVAKSLNELGKKTETRLASRGYSGVEVNELFEDCLSDVSQFDGPDLLKNAFPIYTRQGSKKFIPVFRYLRLAGIESREQLQASNFEAAKKIVDKLDRADFTYPSYRKRYNTAFKGLSFDEIVHKSSSPKEASIMLNFLEDKEFNADALKLFLQNSATLLETEPYRSQFRKLVCRYDKIVYGF